MFIRTLEGLEKAGMIKSLGGGTARVARVITAADGIGFSYSDNRVATGSDMTLWYKHHWEANYIISGRGQITDLDSGEQWVLEAGVLYTVGPNDRHRFLATEDEHHISVFCPSLTGEERHDAEGTYAASGPAPVTDRRMFMKTAQEMRAEGREIAAANGQARTIRMLTQADDIGFGFSDVHFDAGAETILWYKNHWEANHMVSGTGTVEDLSTGESWKLAPGMAYMVGPKDRHRLRAETDLHILSIFSPALRGDEQHDEDGALEPSGPVPSGPPGY